MHIGRFAPSPTGPLHFGSLVTAVASFCHVKHQHGKWLLRLEDTDWQRCKPTYSDDILATLDAFGLHWDKEVRYQSQHISVYDELLHQLSPLTSKSFETKSSESDKPSVYACQCSRKSIQQYLNRQNQHDTNNNQPNTYPRICTHKQLAFKNNAIRLYTPDINIFFDDLIQGTVSINPYHDLGDMILKRKDGIYNYIFTASVDDAIQGVTQVVRGLDLLHLTPHQQLIAQAISIQSQQMPLPQTYCHLPLAYNSSGQKLSKQNKATAVSSNNVQETLIHILQVLEQPPVEKNTAEIMLKQAVEQWTLTPLKQQQRFDGVFS